MTGVCVGTVIVDNEWLCTGLLPKILKFLLYLWSSCRFLHPVAIHKFYIGTGFVPQNFAHLFLERLLCTLTESSNIFRLCVEIKYNFTRIFWLFCRS